MSNMTISPEQRKAAKNIRVFLVYLGAAVMRRKENQSQGRLYNSVC